MTPADRIARRVIAELPPHACVNLGVGLPGTVLHHLPVDHSLWLQSETGLLGYDLAAARSLKGPWRLKDEYIDANGNVARVRAGGAVMDLVDAFAWMRTGRVDVAVLGAYQVDTFGRVASWSRGAGRETGMGGAVELLAGAKRVVVAMEHLDRHGRPRLVDLLGLPATSGRRADLIITERGVFEGGGEGFILRELAEGVTVSEVRSATAAPLSVLLWCESPSTRQVSRS